MATSLSGRDFLKLLDFSEDEIKYLLKTAADLKEKKRTRTPHKYLEGRNIVLIFQKTSTRTRCSFEVGAMDLGMGVVYLDPASSQMGKKESLADTARVLDRFFDGIEFRGFAQADVEELAANADAPVWNGLTDEWHPTQMIADVLTMQEEFGEDVSGRTVVFMGDAKNNVARSLMVVCAKLGMNFVACGPESCMPAQDVLDATAPLFAEHGATCTLTSSVEEGCKDADVIYTDVWVSLGEPDEIWEQRIAELSPYQVNAKAMSYAKPEAIFLHCLPAFHDTKTEIGAAKAKQFGITEMEVTDEVFEGPQSRVFDEAENRMHAIKAIMYCTLS